MNHRQIVHQCCETIWFFICYGCHHDDCNDRSSLYKVMGLRRLEYGTYHITQVRHSVPLLYLCISNLNCNRSRHNIRLATLHQYSSKVVSNGDARYSLLSNAFGCGFVVSMSFFGICNLDKILGSKSSTVRCSDIVSYPCFP